MTPAGAKAKGRTWENRIVELLKRSGWPFAERRRLTGSRDQGDIAGIAGVVIEAKAAKSYTLAAWLTETETERVNAKALIAACWVKRVGRAEAQDGFILMSPATFMQLLWEAGYKGGALPNAPEPMDMPQPPDPVC